MIRLHRGLALMKNGVRNVDAGVQEFRPCRAGDVDDVAQRWGEVFAHIRDVIDAEETVAHEQEFGPTAFDDIGRFVALETSVDGHEHPTDALSTEGHEHPLGRIRSPHGHTVVRLQAQGDEGLGDAMHLVDEVVP